MSPWPPLWAILGGTLRTPMGGGRGLIPTRENAGVSGATHRGREQRGRGAPLSDRRPHRDPTHEGPGGGGVPTCHTLPPTTPEGHPPRAHPRGSRLPSRSANRKAGAASCQHETRACGHAGARARNGLACRYAQKPHPDRPSPASHAKRTRASRNHPDGASDARPPTSLWSTEGDRRGPAVRVLGTADGPPVHEGRGVFPTPTLG